MKKIENKRKLRISNKAKTGNPRKPKKIKEGINKSRKTKKNIKARKTHTKSPAYMGDTESLDQCE